MTETLGAFGQALQARRALRRSGEESSTDIGSIRANFVGRLAVLFSGHGETEEVSSIRQNLVGLADQLSMLLTEAEMQGALAKELETANAAQRLLIPGDNLRLAGIRMASLFEPASSCGGDIWAAYPLVGGRSLFLVRTSPGMAPRPRFSPASCVACAKP